MNEELLLAPHRCPGPPGFSQHTFGIHMQHTLTLYASNAHIPL